MCDRLGIRAVFKSGNTLRQSLMRVKSRRRDEQKKGVVYEVPCGGWQSGTYTLGKQGGA